MFILADATQEFAFSSKLLYLLPNSPSELAPISFLLLSAVPVLIAKPSILQQHGWTLRGMILNEISQTEKDKYHMIPLWAEAKNKKLSS